MVFSFLLFQLADSYPIRRAAQFGAYVAHKGKQIGKSTYDIRLMFIKFQTKSCL